MQLYKGKLCVEYADLIETGIMKRDNLRYHLRKCNIKSVRRSCYGTNALYDYSTAPNDVKIALIQRLGDPLIAAQYKYVKSLKKEDDNARMFFEKYALMPNGKHLPQHKADLYTKQAEWLNVMCVATVNLRWLKKEMCIGSVDEFYRIIITLMRADDAKLPESKKRLVQRMYEYKENGYISMVKVAMYGNKNASKTFTNA